MNKDPIVEIARIDGLLDLNREMLIDAAKLPEADRPAQIAKVKGRINALLDERLTHMKERK